MAQGIKETKEALVALALMIQEVKKAKADGLDFNDLVAFLAKLNDDPEFAGKLMAGLDNLSAVPDEVSDLSLMEGIELLRLLPDLFKK